ncbi:MAG: hypothetical protein J2P44_03540 [Candidatus Dormibacteraeota bacterium]|nr:hypothetical protein [Candidatus Dormibacteraeota bacterium]
MNSPERFTKEALAQRARELGYDDVSPRLVLDWAGQGLLDRPDRAGRGRGQGVSSTWPANQLQLFIAILQHRAYLPRKSLASLCNIPVWTWLVWGDAYVPVRQAKRALRTWAGPATGGSAARGRAAAQDVVESLKPLGSTKADRMRLVDALTKQYFAGHRQFDRGKLRPLLEAVIHPEGGSSAVGPREAPISADIYLDLLEARLWLARNLDRVTDEEWQRARAAYRFAWLGYNRIQSSLAADPQLGRMYLPGTDNDFANNACAHLVTILGLLRSGARSG